MVKGSTTLGPGKVLPGQLQYEHENGVLLLLCFHSPVFEGYKKNYGNDRGKPHRKLIRKLIASIRQHSPSLKVAVATDDNAMLVELGVGVDIVVELDLRKQKRSHQEKLFALLRTPFRRTVYLDADSIVCSDLTPVFSDLESIDVGFTRQSECLAAGNMTLNAKITAGRLHASEQFYSAFIAYKMSTEVTQFLKSALDISLQWNKADQEALLYAVRHNSGRVRVQLLNHEYLYVDRGNELPVVVARDVLAVHGVEATCKVNDVKGPRLLFTGRIMQVLK